MTTRRLILLTLTTVLIVGAFLLATSDVHTRNRNCGSALLPRDTTGMGLNTGDTARDDFSVQEVSADCRHLILRQRYLLALTVAAAGVTGVLAKRSHPKVERFPGDPIV